MINSKTNKQSVIANIKMVFAISISSMSLTKSSLTSINSQDFVAMEEFINRQK